MTITLNIRPEVQAELARQAAVQGRALEAVATALLEEAVHVPALAPANVNLTEPKSLFDLFAPVRGLLTDEEIDHMFTRNVSGARPVDFS